MHEKIRKWLPWVMIVLFIAVVYGPRWIGNATANRFGKPLFAYPLPEDAVLVSQDAARDGEGVITAALLLQTDQSIEELEAYYADLRIEPVKDGQTISVEAKALTEADLDVLKTAKLYVEGEQYRFVYVTSK